MDEVYALHVDPDALYDGSSVSDPKGAYGITMIELDNNADAYALSINES